MSVDPLRDVLLSPESVSAARVADLQRAARRLDRRLTVPLRDGLTTATLSSPWAAGTVPLAWTVTADGLVIIEGQATGGTVSSTVATGLPAARGTITLVAAYASAPCALTVSAAGVLTLAGGTGSGTLEVAAHYLAA